MFVEDLEQQVAQSSAQREEVIRLKQELQLLRRDLVLTGAHTHLSLSVHIQAESFPLR